MLSAERSLFPLLFFLTRNLLGNPGALLACAILTIHPLHVYFSQEIRMYAFLFLLILGIVWVAFRIIASGDRMMPWYWVLLSLLAWGIMATQYLGGAVAGGIWVGLLAAQSGKKITPKWFLIWLASGGVAVLGIIPFLLWGTRWGMVTNFEPEYPLHLLIVRDLIDGLEGHIHSAPWTFFGMHGGRILLGLAWLAPLIAFHLLGFRTLSCANRRAEAIFLLTFLCGCTLLLALYQASGMRFYTRYYVLLVPASAILMGAAFSQGPKLLRIPIFTLLVALFLSNSITCVQKENRETSDLMSKRILATGKKQPVLVENIGLALSIKAILPQMDVRHGAQRGEYQPVEQNLLTDAGIARTWPDAWQNRSVWIVLGGWGNLPRTEADLQQQMLEFSRRMGIPKGSLRVCGMDAIQNGLKWSALFEWTPQ